MGTLAGCVTAWRILFKCVDRGEKEPFNLFEPNRFCGITIYANVGFERQSLFALAKRGKSGHHREGRLLTGGRSNPTESAAENKPPHCGKGENVR